MKKKNRNRIFGLIRAMFMPLVALAVLLCFFTGISNIRSSSGDEGKKQLEESIRRTAAACYASEGVYPPTVEYMKEKYGLQIDEDRYFVDYKAFASNLMPDFTVIERAGAEDR